MAATASLQVESIAKRYPARGRELVILQDVSLTLDKGQSAAIMGPSGSGKSTLLNILGTLETPDAGRMLLNGENPFTLSPRELARFRNRAVGFVFQEHHLLPQCTVIENVLIPTLADRTQRNGVNTTARALELLNRVGLSDRLDHRPSELSGGERQRVAIARALINRPTLLLADEPTGNLDRRTADGVADLIVELQRIENFILVLVTHADRIAERFGQTYELVEGRLTLR